MSHFFCFLKAQVQLLNLALGSACMMQIWLSTVQLSALILGHPFLMLGFFERGIKTCLHAIGILHLIRSLNFKLELNLLSGVLITIVLPMLLLQPSLLHFYVTWIDAFLRSLRC